MAEERPEVAVCSDARTCPISQGRCPGSCVFAEVMQSQSLGVVVFDCGADALVFANRATHVLLERAGRRADYPTLRALFLPPGEAPAGPSAVRRRDPLRVGSRLLGYTLYRGGRFAWVLVRDITEKERLESIAEAVESMNNIGYVFSAVRHELGNPVNSIKAALSVLRANLDSYSKETVAEYLDGMGAELGRVENLLRSLKTFSLYERPEIQPVELGALLNDFARRIWDETRRRDISLSVEVARECWAACDPRAMQQVLLNLFANAADAVAGRAKPEVRLAASGGGELAVVRVQDNGPGMTLEQRQKVFKPFHTTKERGTGLGLVISRKMVVRMSGTIAVDSEQGLGTTVTITLPASRAEGVTAT